MAARKLLLPRFKSPQARSRVKSPQRKPTYPNDVFKLEPFQGGIAVTLEKKDVAQLYQHSARGFFHDPHAPKRAHVLEVSSLSPGDRTFSRSRVSREALHFLLNPRTMQHFVQRGIMGYVGYTKSPEIIRFVAKNNGYVGSLLVSPGRDRFTEKYFGMRLALNRRDPSDVKHPVTFIFLPFPPSLTGVSPHTILSMINSLSGHANRAWEKRAR